MGAGSRRGTILYIRSTILSTVRGSWAGVEWDRCSTILFCSFWKCVRVGNVGVFPLQLCLERWPLAGGYNLTVVADFWQAKILAFACLECVGWVMWGCSHYNSSRDYLGYNSILGAFSPRINTHFSPMHKPTAPKISSAIV